ncbi:hypothetical protein [Niallia taxi]|uniref:hypothetical protein n=1 Tax=Niallia taxi TaxID=2499688 RepID=UPI0015F54416|nr:hypothetical protein [Niallia taxi]
MRNHIIFTSGGLSSFAVADFVKQHFPMDNILLYFTDTLWENADLYRFIKEASDKLELPLLTHADGRTPIQVMFDEKFIFNSRVGNCSKRLKMEVSDRFIRKGIKPKFEKWRNRQYLKNENFLDNPILYFGIGFNEMHRQDAIAFNWQPYQVEFPLIDHIIDNDEILAKYSIRRPELYDLSFSHNNCNGRCVKGGQAHFANLYDKMPDVYNELKIQEFHLKNAVDSYHYLMRLKKEVQENDPWDLAGFIEMELEQLDKAYRPYFYGEVEKPGMYLHPSVSASADQWEFRTYAFMKKTKNKVTKPLMLKEFESSARAMLRKKEEIKRKNGVQVNLFELSEQTDVDVLDHGGCGCFFDYEDVPSDNKPALACKLSESVVPVEELLDGQLCVLL